MLPHLVGFASNGFDFEHEFCQSTFRQVPEPGQSTSYVARHSSALVVLDLASVATLKQCRATSSGVGIAHFYLLQAKNTWRH